MIAEQTMTSQGVLELHPKGFGFLRNPSRHYAAQAGDPYVPAPLIQKHSLREGMLVGGTVEPPKKGASGPRLTAVAHIETQEPRKVAFRNWDELTPIDPHEQVVMETPGGPLTTRVMDLFTPIGKGQRGLIVAPRGRARRSCCRTSPRPSARTTRRCTSSCCSSTSGRRR